MPIANRTKKGTTTRRRSGATARRRKTAGKKSAPPSVKSDRLETGVYRFEELTGGGLKKGHDVLVAGPNFCGRDIFIASTLAAQLKKAIPAVIVLTEMTPLEFSRKMRAVYSKYPLYEKRGYVKYLDVYSRFMGLKEKESPARKVKYVSDIKDLNSWLKDITAMEKSWYNVHDQHLFVFNSIHTLYNYFDTQKANAFLQALGGRTTLLKATALYDLSTDALPPERVNQIASFMDSTVEFRIVEGDAVRYQMRVRGIPGSVTTNWVEYKFDEKEMKLVGPFIVEVIR